MSDEKETAQPVSGLVVLLKANNVSEETALAISPAFTELYDLANEWKNKADDYLNNPEISEPEKAEGARKARLALVKVRTGIDKKRKELNDEDQKRITDRNNAAKVLTALVTPIEEKCIEVEKKAENEEKERKAALKVERLAKLEPYQVDCTYYDLENMPDPAFDQLLENSRLLHEKKIEDHKKKEEQDAYAKMILARVESVLNEGFRVSNPEGRYSIEIQNHIGDACFGYIIEPDDFEKSEPVWLEFWHNIKQQIAYYHEKVQKEKEAEQNRLKAEKEKAEREAALLKQQEKEKQIKHEETLRRQKKLSDISVIEDYQKLYDMDEGSFNELAIFFSLVLRIFISEVIIERTFIHIVKLSDISVIEDYQKLYDMDEGSFNDYFTDKNSQYQAEENRKFIERKKSEREAALKKEEEEKAAAEKRRLELAPEKEKLKVWLDSLKFSDREDMSNEANTIASDIYYRFEQFKKWAEDQINTLK